MNLKKAFPLILLILIILVSQTIFSDILINEIMHSPLAQEPDEYNEWVELYNNGTDEVDLSEYKICNKPLDIGFIYRNGSVFRNKSFMLSPDSYAIITDNVTEVYEHLTIPNDTLSLHVKWGSICSMLTSNEIINLSNDDFSSIFAYNKTTENGYSLELIDGEYIQSENLGGTFGLKNNATKIIVNESEDIINYLYDAEINISKTNYSLNEPLNITGYISVNGTNKSVNITIKIARKINSTYNYKWYVSHEKEFIISGENELSNLSLDIFNYTIPSDFIKGEYKIHLSLKYEYNNSHRYKYSDELFYVDGLEDLGDYTLEIIDYPQNMGFGEIKNIFVKLNSNNYNLKNASIVAYAYSPRWASIDLSDETLMTRPYDSNVAVKINEIKRGTTNYFSIPILTKRNCNNDYDDGLYSVKIRAYENNEDLLEKNINISISGINDAMCPKTIVETKTVNSKRVDTKKDEMSDKEKNDNSFSYGDIKFRINHKQEIDNYFETEIEMNNTNESKKISIQTYVISSRTKISEVIEENVELSEFQNKKIVLKGDILKFDLTDNTKLVIKLNSSNRKTDKSISYPIELKKKENSGKIIDFYPVKNNKNNKSDEIYLEAELICEKGHIVVFDSSFKSKNLSCKKTVRFSSKLMEGRNVFLLTLIKDGKAVDLKKVIIGEENENFAEFHKISIESYKNNDVDALLSKTSSKNLITGNIINERIIYESTNEKLKKLINYLLPIVFIIGTIAFIWGKKYG